ncbi:MAG: recombinase RecT [Agromyces sp.]
MPDTAVALIPKTGEFKDWTDRETALMEFAGLGQLLRLPNQPPKWQGAPRKVIEAFVVACQRTQLDPIAKQIYAAEMSGKWTILVGVDGMRLVAQRTGQYGGQTPKEWLYPDGQWRSYWIPEAHGGEAGGKPLAARVGIIRKGFAEPLVVTVTWAEFGMEPRFKGDNWGTRPGHMLGIRAETHGLRAAFPMELSGLYTPEDMDGTVLDAELEPSRDWSAAIKATASRTELTNLYRELRESGEWTQNLHDEFAVHGAALPKDEAPAGAPGNTGDAELDGAVDAEVVEDEPTAEMTESDEERFERESREQFDTEQAVQA